MGKGDRADRVTQAAHRAELAHACWAVVELSKLERLTLEGHRKGELSHEAAENLLEAARGGLKEQRRRVLHHLAELEPDDPAVVSAQAHGLLGEAAVTLH